MNQDLLGIDLEAALGKLATGRLLNRAQIPLALARALAMRGPALLRIRLGRTSIGVEHEGRPLEAESLHRLRCLLDPTESPDARLAALEATEQAGELDLLTAFGCRARRVELEAGLPTGLRLRWSQGQPELQRSSRPTGSRILLRGCRGLDGGRMRGELKEHLRFAPYPVELDGRRISKGLHLDEQVQQMPFAWGEHRGVLGLPRQGRAQRFWILNHGVLDRVHWMSSGDGLIFDVLIDTPNFEDEKLREGARKLLPEMLERMTQRWPELSGRKREELLRVILRMVDSGADARALFGDLPLFAQLNGPDLTVGQLPQAARGRVLYALDPKARPERYMLDLGSVLVLDSLRRDFIQRHLGLLIREPMRKPSGRGRLGRRLLRRGAELSTRLRRLVAGGRLLEAEQLSVDERAFVAALEEVFASKLIPNRRGVQVRLSRGRSGGWRWREPNMLVLSGRNPKVRRWIEAWRAEPASLFAILLLLDPNGDPFGEMREEATERLLGLTRPSAEPTLVGSERQ